MCVLESRRENIFAIFALNHSYFKLNSHIIENRIIIRINNVRINNDFI